MDFTGTAVDIAFIPVYIIIALMVHEYGHYLAARLSNIAIESYTIGYGRTIWSKKDRQGTNWKIKLLPIAGHVQLSAEGREKNLKGVMFDKAPTGQRLFIVLAGPLANILFAFLLMLAFLFFVGLPSKKAVITGVEPGEAAYQAGLIAGDEIIAVESRKILRYREVWEYTAHMPGRPLNMVIRRGNETFETVLTPSLLEYINTKGVKKSHGRMGVMIGYSFLDLKVVNAVNGVDIGIDDKKNKKKKRDKVRKMLLPLLGQDVSLGLKSTDGETHIYNGFLVAELNGHLRDPDHDDYDSFVLGSVKDNFYLRLKPAESFAYAISQTGRMIKSIAMVPFQMFPIDHEHLRPWAVVKADQVFVSSSVYEFLYRIMLVSIFIGLLNLIPFPSLDGSVLLQIIIGKILGLKDPAHSKEYKYALLGLLSLLYAGILIANADDLPRYLSMKVEDVKELKS